MMGVRTTPDMSTCACYFKWLVMLSHREAVGVPSARQWSDSTQKEVVPTAISDEYPNPVSHADRGS